MAQGIDIGRALTTDEIDGVLVPRGKVFVFRYLDRLSTTEIATLLSRRIAIALFYERSGAGALTYDAGKVAGADARSLGLALGVPLRIPIYDADATDTDVDPTAPGFIDRGNGFYDGLDGAYVAGIYGSYRVCKYVDENFVAYGRACQTIAWSGGAVYAPSDAYQYAEGVKLTPTLEVDLVHGDLPEWRLA